MKIQLTVDRENWSRIKCDSLRIAAWFYSMKADKENKIRHKVIWGEFCIGVNFALFKISKYLKLNALYRRMIRVSNITINLLTEVALERIVKVKKMLRSVRECTCSHRQKYEIAYRW